MSGKIRFLQALDERKTEELKAQLERMRAEEKTGKSPEQRKAEFVKGFVAMSPNEQAEKIFDLFERLRKLEGLNGRNLVY